MAVNYLNKKDLLIEIHKSKLTYCSLINSDYQDSIYKYYDIIVTSLSEIDKELIDYTKKFKAERLYKQKRDELLKMGFKPHEIKLSFSLDNIKDEDVVFRIMTYDHVPYNKKQKKTTKDISEKDKHERVNFTPFKHYIFVNGEPVEVLRSHWIGTNENGCFSNSHGHMTNNLARMFMKIVDKFSQKSNWRGYCVDESTEALTQRGWLGIDQINENDKILSYSEGDMKWSNIKSIYRGDFDGNMHNLTMRGLDMLITPNHKLVTQRGLIPVEFLKKTDHLILMGNHVKDEIEKTHSDSFVDLMGWVLTEGCYNFYKGSKEIKSITIYQNPGLKADRIRNCLIDLGYKFTERLRKRNIGFRIWKESSEQITKYFPEKNLNMEFILSLTSDQRENLINTMIDGDGWRRQGKYRSYTQKNKEHVDLFQILCTISGHRIMTKKRESLAFGKNLFIFTMNLYSQSKNITKVECIDFHGGKNNGREYPGRGKEYHPNIPTTYYKGKVWCPETEYGCFVARRNNTIYLTGNTYVDEMRAQALVQLSQVGLQFDEDRSNIPNPFAYYTAVINASFTKVLNTEKKNQSIRDDILETYGATPSYTRQNEWEEKTGLTAEEIVRIDPDAAVVNKPDVDKPKMFKKIKSTT